MSLTATAAAEAAKVAAETATAVKTLFSAASKNLVNTRKTKHTFKIPNQCVIHGLAGFLNAAYMETLDFQHDPTLSKKMEMETESCQAPQYSMTDQILRFLIFRIRTTTRRMITMD